MKKTDSYIYIYIYYIYYIYSGFKSHSGQLSIATVTTRHGATRKRKRSITKRLKDPRNLFRKKLRIKVSVNSRLKAI